MKLYFLGLLYPQLMHIFGTCKNWELKAESWFRPIWKNYSINLLAFQFLFSVFTMFHLSSINHTAYRDGISRVYRLWCLNSGMLKSTMYWPLPWMEEWRFASSPWNVQASEIPNISKIQIWSRLFSRLQLIIKYFVLLFWKRKWTLVI